MRGEKEETKTDSQLSVLREKVVTFTEIVKSGGETNFRLKIMSLVLDVRGLRCLGDIQVETSRRQVVGCPKVELELWGEASGSCWCADGFSGHDNKGSNLGWLGHSDLNQMPGPQLSWLCDCPTCPCLHVPHRLTESPSLLPITEKLYRLFFPTCSGFLRGCERRLILKSKVQVKSSDNGKGPILQTQNGSQLLAQFLGPAAHTGAATVANQ